LSKKSRSGREHGIEEEGSPDFDDFVGFRPIFQIVLNSDEIFVGITVHGSPESLLSVEDMLGTKKLLLRAFWEKVPTLRNFETSGAYIANF
jgi:hypothetical protein